ncbi:Amyloid beta A4 precursor protein-binding family B member 1-interacting protein [Choanephora cucurbitarum]|uniref:Amyloid beta A4 protein-binding family B member 1-interacting protein n=1 Tax=Choanephora cucurbitarum TaxID=101091 RepID=A0A1C7NN53_9FUNG|nr:Amyloid beta A4 precursor protein-binding family B member 1-interacting protein [Choanephora cucurbitarum]
MEEHQVASEHITIDKRYYSKNSQDNVPLQHYKATRAPHYDSRDDDVCIGTILQRSVTARRPNDEKLPALTHSRSLKVASSRSKQAKEEFHEDEELRLAMQRAWALLDANPEKVSGTTVESTTDGQDTSNMVSSARIQTVPLKTLTTRIYIDDANNHKVVQLTNLLTTAMVVQYLRKKGLLESSDDWTLFEIDNSHGVERPLREWEIVLNTLSVWEPDASNALLIKKYPYHHTLTPESVLQPKIAPMHGWLYIEYKKGKWQKRYCFVKDNAIYHAKDNNKSTSSSVLCYLANYDVYTLLHPSKSSPASFVFAIRAQNRPSIFENESDYIRLLALESQEEMKDWVLSIRNMKSLIQYQQNPARVVNPLTPIALENTFEEKPNTLRRHKSTKESSHKEDYNSTKPPSSGSNHSESVRRSDDKRPLGRSATLRGTSRNNSSANEKDGSENGPLIDCFDTPTFAKGSLLAKEEEQEQVLYRQQQQELQRQQEEASSNANKTLIQVEDRVTFSKGSLLDKKENSSPTVTKMTRSKSVREVSSTPPITEPSEHRRHVSLRRKPTSSRRHHDVPLPNNAAIASLPSTPSSASSNQSPKPSSKAALLQLGDTPESFHTKELYGRHMKPLISFGSSEKFSKKQ